MTRLLALIAYLVAVAAIAAGIGWIALTDGLDRLEERAQSDLSLAADRLTGQLQRYRELAVTLADHPQLQPLVLDGRGDAARASEVLMAAADRTGSLEIALVDATGAVLATSLPIGERTASAGNAPEFRRAMQGALGYRQAVDPATGHRVFLYAAPIFSDAGPVRGAVIVRLSVNRIEANWQGDAPTVFFTDAEGVVFVSNRSELVFATRSDAARVGTTYPTGLLHPFVSVSARWVRGHDLWAVDGGPYLPRRALHLTQPLPVAGMTAEILLDSAPAARMAALQSATAAALLMILGAAFWVLSERRQALADRLAIEARAKADLERRVEARTRELSHAVEQLQQEVRERQEAEAALKKAQNDLIQAGKLSALGQMSAGISHELNQPLMAIRSFAENAQQFLDRGKPEAAGQNLGQISDLARRMGRIIKNLRTFARAENEALSDVDLVAGLRAVLELVESRIERAGVQVDWAASPGPVLVRGGEVRLQQVLMNLLTNAIDAMEECDTRTLRLLIDRPEGRVRLRVQDTGRGIREPDRIFDPFYSTKEAAASERMGLGLAISFRIVEGFHGQLSGANRPEGGAEFTLVLDAAAAQVAA